jgi:hypothetical protein
MTVKEAVIATKWFHSSFHAILDAHYTFAVTQVGGAAVFGGPVSSLWVFDAGTYTLFVGDRTAKSTGLGSTLPPTMPQPPPPQIKDEDFDVFEDFKPAHKCDGMCEAFPYTCKKNKTPKDAPQTRRMVMRKKRPVRKFSPKKRMPPLAPEHAKSVKKVDKDPHVCDGMCKVLPQTCPKRGRW